MNSLLVWWLLSGGDIGKLPIAGPQPDPWRQKLFASVAILDLIDQSIAKGPVSDPWRELRKVAINEIRLAVDEIPPEVG